jgi:hypothetical protein
MDPKNLMAVIELELSVEDLAHLKKLSEFLKKPLGVVARQCMMAECATLLTAWETTIVNT